MIFFLSILLHVCVDAVLRLLTIDLVNLLTSLTVTMPFPVLFFPPFDYPLFVYYIIHSQVKAMELIDQMEVTRRGPYSGGFGGISFSGDMDIALALRTMVFPTGTRYNTMYSYKDMNRRQEWVAHLQAGAGIVADSNPELEQRECENKAAGLARAIDLAESTFLE